MSKIIVENIEKTFNKRSGNANRVLKGVSFELPEKGLVCIFGKSGSGKTTLLNIIGGLEKADSGKVYIDGAEMRGHADRIRNAKIGFIFQNYYLERGYRVAEILRNQMILAGFRDETEIARRCDEALKLVDMERFKNKQGDALSGGQQQRVAIARAIVKGSDVILADEPTGNLDAENTMKVMDILKEISRTQLVVIVTHEVSLIRRYADSHIKIVDGELVEDGEIEETDLAPETYDHAKAGGGDHGTILKTFTKSTAKRNGRLFDCKTIFRRGRASGEERFHSAGDLFKQIFLLALAAVVCAFAFSAFEAANAVTETKTLAANTVYTNLNSYSVLRRIDEGKYQSVDFFDTELKTGSFSYGGLASLSGIEVTYTPKAIEAGETLPMAYGRMPDSGEVIVSRAMAEALKKQFRLEELNTDKAIPLMTFDGIYPITGVTDGEEKIIYFNKADYVNFLGVYNRIGFSDTEQLFFADSYGSAQFTAEILLYEGELANDKVRVEINRNALYKMMADITQADAAITKTNSRLKVTPYAIQVTGSKVYVEQFSVTRDVMDTDIRLYVSRDVLKNSFVYISPNLDALSSTGSQYYFAVTAADEEHLSALKNELRDLGVTAVNVEGYYEKQIAEEKADAENRLYLYVLLIALLLTIYFFIEKSASIKNSKEYGIYRAIGVNRSNLLFKECVTALADNIVSYLVFATLATALVAVRYAIMNVPFGGFIGMAAAGFAASALLMVGISLIPYLFVLTESPSEILARYDI